MTLYPTRIHPSFYHNQRIVYPVISRRAGGVSIGVNLSPSKRCNFGCVYCQVHVDRTRDAKILADVSPRVDLERLKSELEATVKTVVSGALFSEERFAAAAPEKRTLKDFAFSGDGEPTLSEQFVEAAEILAAVRREQNLDAVKLVLITNATTLQDERTIAGCDVLAANNGEIWAKLDAGAEARFRRVNRSQVAFETILANIAFAARRWPLAIQTMLMAERGEAPNRSEIDDYCKAVERISAGGGTVRKLQLYTVARAPFEHNIAALENESMDRIAAEIAARTGLPVEVYYSR